MSDRIHLLVVDDEPDIREAIETYFSAQEFRVHSAANGDELRAVLVDHPVSVVILDLRMPGEDGFSLCRWLREHHNLGIIMLTGSTDTVDKIVGLEMGADDYVAKPFDLRELMARVKSVLRRVGSSGPTTEPTAANAGNAEITIGTCQLNLASRTLETVKGDSVTLSAMEFDLLTTFIDHPNRVLSRDQLLDLAHNADWEPFDRSIDVRVTRLRKKIEENPAKPVIIKTIRGVGYLFSPDGK